MICILYAAAFSAAVSRTASGAAPRPTAVSVLDVPAELAAPAGIGTVHALGQSLLRAEEQAATFSST
jgi:hypothetical protein